MRTAIRSRFGFACLSPALVAAAALLVPATAFAQATYFWNNTITTWGSTSAWSTTNSAATPNPLSVPSSIDTAAFGIDTVTSATARVFSNTTVGGLLFRSVLTSTSGTTTALVTGTSIAPSLTIGSSGITVESGVRSVLLGILNPVGGAQEGEKLFVRLNDSQSWTNNSTASGTTLLVGQQVTSGLASGTQTLTIAGAGNTVLQSLGNGTLGGAVALKKIGSGTLTLNASTITGSTTVEDGVLRAAALSGSSRLVVGGVGTSGTVLLSSAVTYTVAGLSSVGSGGVIVSGTGFGNSPATLDVSSAGTDTFAGSLRDSSDVGLNNKFRLTKSGTGTLILTGTSTATGTTTLANGVLQLDFTALASPTNVLAAAVPLQFTGGALAIKGSTTAATAQTFGSVTPATGGGSLLVDTNNGPGTTVNLGGYTGSSAGGGLLVGRSAGSGTGAVTLTTTSATAATGIYNRMVYTDGAAYDWARATGSGTFTIQPLATYAGLTTSGTNTSNSRLQGSGATLTGGVTTNTLKVEDPSAGQSLDAAGNLLTLTGGGLLATGANPFTITGGTVTAGNGAGAYDLVVQQYAAGDLTIASRIADNGANAVGLTKLGGGGLTLSGSNGFTGVTYVSSGTLTLAHTHALAGSTLQMPNVGAGQVSFGSLTDVRLGGLQGSSSLSLTNASSQPVALRVGGNNATTTYSGALVGAGSLTKIGTGTLGIQGLGNTYTGSTSIEQGFLQLNGAYPTGTSVAALGSGTIRIGSAGNAAGIHIPRGAFSGVFRIDQTIEVVAGGTAMLSANPFNETPTWRLSDITGGGMLALRPHLSSISGTITPSFTGGVFTDNTSLNGNWTASLSGDFNSITQGVTTGSGGFLNVRLQNGGTVALAAGTFNVSGGSALRIQGYDGYGAGVTVMTPIVLNGSLSNVDGGAVDFRGLITGTGSVELSYKNNVVQFSNPANSFTGRSWFDSNNNLLTVVVPKLADAGMASSLGAPTGTAATIGMSYTTLVYTGTGDQSNRNLQLIVWNQDNGASSRPRTIANNGTGKLLLTGTVLNNTINNVDNNLFLSGTGAEGELAGPLLNSSTTGGNLRLYKQGTNLWTLSASNTTPNYYSGGTIVQAGVLRLTGSALGSGSASIEPGAATRAVLESNIDLFRDGGSGAGQMRLAANASGTAGFGARDGAVTVQFGVAAPTALTWGTAPFAPGAALVLNGTSSNGMLTFTNGIDLAAATRVVDVGAATAIMSGSLSNGGLQKTGTGTLRLSGANVYSGTTLASAGILQFISTDAVAALSGTARTINVATAAVIVPSYGLDQAFLDRVGTGAPGVVGITGTSAGSLDVSSLTGAFLGATGVAAYSGALTPASDAYRLGGGGGTLDVGSTLSGTRGLIAGGDASGYGGTLILSNAANSFSGKSIVQTGTLQFASIGDVGGGNTALGNPSTAANGQIDVGTGGGGAVLRYVGTGTAGHSSNRLVSITGTSFATLDARGAGPLTFAASGTAVAGGNGVKTLTLAGTSTALNSVGLISGTGISVVKDGSGLWRMTGLSRGFGGSLRVLDGTLQAAAANLGSSSTQPVLLGGTSASATGRAALLLEQGVSTAAYVDVQAPAGTQTVLIGGANTSGTATYSGVFRLDRDVTLAAATGGAVEFSSAWTNAAGTGTPITNVTIGASGGYAGRALLFTGGPLATSGTVAVEHGTAVLGDQTTLSSPNTLRVASGATLAGSGVVTGGIGNGGGLVSPGNSPGILTAGSVDPAGGLGFVFEFTDLDPFYGDPTASVNDVLRLTSQTAPFASALGAGNVVNVLFALTGTAPLVSGTYTGGIFTDRDADFHADVFTSGSLAYWVTGTYGTIADRRQFAVGENGGLVTYSTLAAYNQSLELPLVVSGTVVPMAAAFADGEVQGRVTQFVVVPEPQTLALAGIGVGLAAYALRRRAGR